MELVAIASRWLPLLGFLACNSHMTSTEHAKPRTATHEPAETAQQPPAETAQQPVPAAPAPTDVTSAGPAEIPRCGDWRGAPAVLVRDYSQLEVDPPQLYAIDVRYDDAAQSWLPSPALGMPRHHASSIEWVGELPPATTRTLRILCFAADVQRVPSRRPGVQVDASYRLHIVRVCKP